MEGSCDCGSEKLAAECCNNCDCGSGAMAKDCCHTA